MRRTREGSISPIPNAKAASVPPSVEEHLSVAALRAAEPRFELTKAKIFR